LSRGGTHLTDDHVAGAEPEATDLRLADVDVIGAGQILLGAQEVDAVVDAVQHAAAQAVTALFGLVAQQ